MKKEKIELDVVLTYSVDKDGHLVFALKDIEEKGDED